MTTFRTINPANNEPLKEYTNYDDGQVDAALARAESAYASWRRTTFAQRAAAMHRVAGALEREAEALARIMALEMGKPVTEGAAEARKCAWVCRYYADETERMLAPEPRESDGSEAFVRYDPLGPILAVMPWNYPLWQVYRFAAPNLMAGNVGLLKHASNVPESALAIERIFRECGFPEGVFQTIFPTSGQVAAVIADDRVKGATLTGSNRAGEIIGGAAGKAVKPCVLELGGSDPFIVLDDADVAEAARVGVAARCLNSGQSCIAAKRFIVDTRVYDAFVEQFCDAMRARVMGDPLRPEVNIGPQARTDLRDELAEQTRRSVAAGAECLVGGTVPDQVGAWYPPTVLANVTPGCPAADEEMFGPVAAIMRVDGEDEAITLGNRTEFGLGASLWTRDTERAKRLAPAIDAGCVFVNGLVKSDPRLPFGGVKHSGIGRELGREGLLEFLNTKTVWIK